MKKIILAALFFGVMNFSIAGIQEGLAALKAEDYELALKEFQPLAEQGDASAQSNLGLMYKQGSGVKQNYKEAVNWYRLAADQGDADAQNNLGVMYAQGYGVAKNIVVAYAVFNLTAGHLNDEGIKNRDVCAKKMTPQQIAIAERLTREMAKPNNFSKAMDDYLSHAK